MPTDKSCLNPSSRKLLFARDSGHNRKSQPIKMQNYGVKFPTYTSTKKLLQLRLREHCKKEDKKMQEPDQEVC